MSKVDKHILLRHHEIPDIANIKTYQADGGFETFRKVVSTKMDPVELKNIVHDS
ncbi:MAG: NADH-quinone oxidoreductase subunit F, partial [Chloroflexi bacterium]|nr:NADH-quinone oxidoreductase subunit F [Chloroflexota bacterium]